MQASERRPPALTDRVATLAGVGPRVAEKLEKLGVETVADMLCLLPQRYEDRTVVRPLGSLKPGEKVLVEAELELAEVAFRRRRSLLCRLADRTGTLTLRFFHFSKAQQAKLVRGQRLRCFGEVRAGPTGLEMIHPEYSLVSEAESEPATTLTPVYPATEGLHQQRLRGLVDQALPAVEADVLPDYLADLLPASWPSFGDAIRFLHRPPRGTELAGLEQGRDPNLRRVALEELLAHRLSLRQSADAHGGETALPLDAGHERLAELRAALPFELTDAQESALAEIVADLSSSRAMHRLLQGDVGSGKTVVAAAAALVASAAGVQTAIMAPTELLAEQHFASFSSWLEPLGVHVALLTGSVGGATRAQTLATIAGGEAAVVVGTHALFEKGVEFRRLGLVIVDEQHRFGVHQRLELRRKGQSGEHVPHQLVMTATPIPRTLAMTAYADLDCSVIAELPAGRKAVTTVVIPEGRRAELVERVRDHCRAGMQAYWVCPLIEESEALESSAVLERERELAEALPDLELGLVHGRMKAAEKERVMREFKQGASSLLVATTVIEVGVDVPNASLMIIENAERMGLAQLHQLRGRVGRGDVASHCVLLYKPPLSDVARERLRVMRETSDGFEIAQYDMKLRGPGEVLGTRQTGVMQLKVADLLRDADLLPTVVDLGERLAREHPERIAPLIRRWIKTGDEYAHV